MNTVTIGISGLDETMKRVAAAFRGEPQGERISFASVELLWKTITPRRWTLIRSLAGLDPMSIDDIANRLGQDAKTVQSDVQALLRADILSQDGMGRIHFPYDAVHVDFTITKAAS